MKRKLLYVCCCIVVCVAFFSQCVNNGAAQKQSEDLRGKQFAGAAACIACHKEIYDTYLSTAHYKTSAAPSGSSIKGSFSHPDNFFIYNNGEKVVMEKRDSGLFQVSYKDSELQQIHRFSVVMGSGTKAQTFLYYEDDKYFQLPVSYFVPTHSWANSPGFPAIQPRFDRMIPSVCFGCHSSMVGIKSTEMVGLSIAEKFDGKVIYGIDCERCHGPAAEHVSFHTEHPQEKKAMFMTAIGSLKNQQKLDMCALCHSGIKTPQKSAFGFKPGDNLSDYFYADIGHPAKPSTLDVHGTQYQLFTSSQCFIKSNGAMNCSSCHNPHTNEKENLALFSQRCMSCHNTDKHTFCTVKDVSPALLQKNCIDCHMPALPSGTITLQVNGHDSPVPDYIRTHLITTYEAESKKVLQLLKKQAMK
ncbi:MAG: multiheme c-type cytochrome [Chitinophagaceae bacterium]